MKSKIKNFCIPLVLMIITNLGYYYLTNAPNFGGELHPHLGILFIAGLFFGPYGCAGAVVGNFLCDLTRGYSPGISVVSAVISYIISYLAYKLWYTKSNDRFVITRPRLNNLPNFLSLLVIIMVCGILYSQLTTNITEIFYLDSAGVNYFIGERYFINFINFSFLFSTIGIIICRFKDFSYTPELSDKTLLKDYRIVAYLIVLAVLINLVFDITGLNNVEAITGTVILTVLLVIYVQKPIQKLENVDYVSIPEKIMNYFVVLTLLVLVINMFIMVSPVENMIFASLYTISSNQHFLILLLLLDIDIILFFVPALILLKYVESKVINPINSFSRIESFIKKDERIKSDGILDIYSDYIDQDDEIGILSRSYTDLINNNNEYIDNLETLEGEKHRIKTELNIAHNIQQATLPPKSMDNEYVHVDGYCSPAKEVGGDFYDYYQIDDENIMIMIGDASGKGVPAAIFTIITQNSIKLLIKNELDPAKVLYDINNQICENNTEMMFITLFLAIYNTNTHTLTYANAGHNPPIIKNEGKYELLDVDSEIVMGIMEEYTYTNHEIRVDDEFIIYTDGLTDSQNAEHELYGEDRLINCLNNKENEDTIKALISDINNFSKEEEQFDDMTLLTLKVKK